MNLSLESIINLPPEKKVDHYCFNYQAKLGKGSFSDVYAGFDENNGNIVAIKTINKKLLLDDYLYKALQAEIDIMKKLHHSNLVRFYNMITTINNAYIIAEYCNGGDLSTLLSSKRHLPEPEALLVMSDVIKGMRELIKNNIIHRDLKPANIFINDGVFKIGDFGFAKQLQDRSDQSMNTIVGTPYYMPPHYLQNGIFTIKHDIWSLGVTYYEILYGSIPWPSRDRDQLIRNIYSRPLHFPQNIEVSSDSKDFIRKCLEINEDRRITWDEIFNSELFFLGTNIIKKENLELNNKTLNKRQSSLNNGYNNFNDDNIEMGQKKTSFENKNDYQENKLIKKKSSLMFLEDLITPLSIFETETYKRETNNTESVSEEFQRKEKNILENNENFLNVNFLINEKIPLFSKNKSFSQNMRKLENIISFMDFIDLLRNLIESVLYFKLIKSLEKAHFLIAKQRAIVSCFLSEIETNNILKLDDWMNFKETKSFFQFKKKIHEYNDKSFQLLLILSENHHLQDLSKLDMKFSKIYYSNQINENKEFFLITDYFIVYSIEEINEFLRNSIYLERRTFLKFEEVKLVRLLAGLIEYHNILSFFLHNTENNEGEGLPYNVLMKEIDFEKLHIEIAEKKIDFTFFQSLVGKIHEINP